MVFWHYAYIPHSISKGDVYMDYFLNYDKNKLKKYLKLFNKHVNKKYTEKNNIDIIISKMLLPSFMSKELMGSFVEFLLKDIESKQRFKEEFNNFRDVLEVRFETHYNVGLNTENNDIWKIFSRDFNESIKAVKYAGEIK